MNKFENVDIFASLDAIMRQNTGFFQSDFDIDKEIIAKAAASPNREDKTLLILSILVYTFFTRMFDFMLPLVVKYSIVAA